MFHRLLLQYLNDACQALQDPRLPEIKQVYYPNETIPADAYEQSVFFEVFTGSEAPFAETESSDVSTVVGSIVVNGKQNVGISLLDAIARALMNQFMARNPNRKIGFTTTHFDDECINNVYIVNVERSEGGIDDGRYKITVFITFEIYKE